MSFLSYPITALSNLVGNFGVAVVISVLICFVLTIPFKVASHKNNKAKLQCDPAIAKIRKKYNANAMGLSMDDENLAPEIRKLSRDERADAMAKEIETVYKQHGYKAFTGWIPTAITIAFIILLYQGITAAIPEGAYALRWTDIKDSLSEHSTSTWIFGGMVTYSILQSLINAIITLIKSRKLSKKGLLIGAQVFSVALSAGLTIWIASSTTTAIALAILTLSILSTLEQLTTKLITPKVTAK